MASCNVPPLLEGQEEVQVRDAHGIPCADVSCPQWICQRVRVPVTRAEKDARIVALEARLASLSAELEKRDSLTKELWESEQFKRAVAAEAQAARYRSALEKLWNECRLDDLLPATRSAVEDALKEKP